MCDYCDATENITAFTHTSTHQEERICKDCYDTGIGLVDQTNEPITQTTTVIGRNIADIDELASWIRGLIGRGIAHWHTPNMIIRDVRSVQPFFHKFDECFDVLAIVVLCPEEQQN